jgi:hypothetical protein
MANEKSNFKSKKVLVLSWVTFHGWKKIGEKAVQNKLTVAGVTLLFCVLLLTD